MLLRTPQAGTKCRIISQNFWGQFWGHYRDMVLLLIANRTPTVSAKTIVLEKSLAFERPVSFKS